MKILIYSSVGDRNLAAQSFCDAARQSDIDLAVAYYGKSPETKLKTAARYFQMQPGAKFENLTVFLTEHPEVLDEYQYVFVPDDDICVEADMLRQLAVATDRYRLGASSFAHCWSGKPSWYPHMMQAPHKSGFGLTNFVEMTCPLIPTDTLRSFVSAFRPIAEGQFGWGADFVISSACWSPQRPLGVMHNVAVRNAFDHERPVGNREIDSLVTTRVRQTAWERVAVRFSFNHINQIDNWAPDPQVYCVNLKRATERRQQVRSTWIDEHGCDVQFIVAVDRRDLDLHNLPFNYHAAHARSVVGRELTDAEIACARSHLKAMTAALEYCGPEGAVIMEDDSEPLCNAGELFQRIREAKTALPELDVIRCDLPYSEYTASETSGRCRKLSSPPWGSALTWYSRKGLISATEKLERLSMPSDWIHKEFAAEGVMGMLDPPVAIHPGDTSYLCHSFPGQRRTAKP